MSQTWSMPSGTTLLSQAVKTDIPNALQSLRSMHSGNDAPSSTTPYMLWLDVDGAMVKQRNAADSDWVEVYPPLIPLHQVARIVQFGTVTASTVRKMLIATRAVSIIAVKIWASGTTSGSSGVNNWEFQLRNASTGLHLFSSNPTTFASVGGVGGGAEVTADVAYSLTANQNKAMAVNDILTFNIVENGSASNLNDTAVELYYTFTA